VLADPAREAYMVRVHMRADDTGDRLAAHESLKKRLPELPGIRQIQTGINNCPTVSVFQQPEIDVVKGHGHRKTHPIDAFGNSSGLTGFGVHSATPGVLEAAIDF
jgi:hypothetical protein